MFVVKRNSGKLSVCHARPAPGWAPQRRRPPERRYPAAAALGDAEGRQERLQEAAAGARLIMENRVADREVCVFAPERRCGSRRPPLLPPSDSAPRAKAEKYRKYWLSGGPPGRDVFCSSGVFCFSGVAGGAFGRSPSRRLGRLLRNTVYREGRKNIENSSFLAHRGARRPAAPAGQGFPRRC